MRGNDKRKVITLRVINSQKEQREAEQLQSYKTKNNYRIHIMMVDNHVKYEKRGICPTDSVVLLPVMSERTETS